MNKFPITLLSGALSLFSASYSFADSDADTEVLEQITIIGSSEDLVTLSGSATLLDEESIAEFDATDLNDLLTMAPGVYIRYEDGYGLRPNIGIRGVTSDRSQKITIMEDGILISPAPYTAPAAYYIPNVNRMQNLELVKGPAAIKHGPHTIGGALNLVTASTSSKPEGLLSATYGSDNYYKLRATHSNTPESLGGQWSYHIDALTFGADGFKELENGDNTGFVRNDINAKVQWRSAQDAELQQTVTLKLGYADEDSDETYLGLTDADFDQDPNQRYAASELDNFTSEHRQVHLLHDIFLSPNLGLSTRAYYNRFDRAWNKFDGFLDAEGNRSIAAQTVLANPEIFTTYVSALRGEQDTTAIPGIVIDVTNNDRSYGSQGLSMVADYSFDTGKIEHILEAGIRYHHDYVERHHKVKGYNMESGSLVFDGIQDRTPKALNEASSTAIAVFIHDEMSFDNWTINAGVRFESIDGEFDNGLTETKTERSQSVVAPGLGAYYQLTDTWGVLAGVYKGFSPAGPSSDESVDPEESINYEYGVRYRNGSQSLDAIGFFSDYSNLIGRCRASDSNCTVGDEFNGGEVEVAGLELTAADELKLANFLVPIEFVYTYTESAFQTSFESGFSQWGTVRASDELPYLPQHQARLNLGLEQDAWQLVGSIKYTDRSREVPGQGAFDSALSTESHTTLDLSAAWQALDDLNLKLIVENITDEQVIVSRRPFGARPSQPRSIKANMTWEF